MSCINFFSPALKGGNLTAEPMKSKNHYHDLSMWKGATPGIFSKAKDLRENMTTAEVMLWEKLKKNQLLGYKFRRQHPINLFIADFYCHKLNLIIELDGKYHDSKAQKKLDRERNDYLESFGIEVMRISNDQIISNIAKTVQEIQELIKVLEKKF